MENIVNILGTYYTIKYRTDNEDVKLINRYGYTDFTTKEIVVCNFESFKDEQSVSDLMYLQKETLRHEIIHAFLSESGLRGSTNQTDAWALHEEMIDWWALQFPKIYQAFKDAEAI